MITKVREKKKEETLKDYHFFANRNLLLLFCFQIFDDAFIFLWNCFYRADGFLQEASVF